MSNLTLQTQTSTTQIETGLDFILSHLEEPLFPRKISTYKSHNGQFLVRSKQELINSFKESNWFDCRINAFPPFTHYKEVQICTPNLLFIDLDKNEFKSEMAFKLALTNTLKNIKDKLDSQTSPTVLWSGNGYHIIQPVYCPTVLENVKEFQKFDRPSEQFLRFAKDYLSDGKADKNNNPSFKSCLLRIPGSINSKNNAVVQVIQKWNGYRPRLPKELLLDFRRYLIQKKIDEYSYRQKKLNARRYTNNNNIIFWIEKLLNTPVADFRKNASSLILAPYLIHIKKLSYQESFDILSEWLKKCDSIRKLDFNSKYLVKYALKTANNKGFPPMKLATLRNKDLELFHILKEL